MFCGKNMKRIFKHSSFFYFLFKSKMAHLKNKRLKRRWKDVNPLSPYSDQHQISPCNINAYSTPEVMRIKDMIIQGKFSLITSPQYFYKKSMGTRKENLFFDISCGSPPPAVTSNPSNASVLCTCYVPWPQPRLVSR